MEKIWLRDEEWREDGEKLVGGNGRVKGGEAHCLAIDKDTFTGLAPGDRLDSHIEK